MTLFINFKLLLPVLLFCQYAYSVDDKQKDDFQQTSDGQGQSLYWFGPRLGKRSVDDRRETLLKLFEAVDALKYYYDQLPAYEGQSDDGDNKGFKVYFTPKLGRSLNTMFQDDKRFENVEFTPRLGRRLPEDYGVTQPDQDVYKSDPDQKDRRNKYFSPRLGRSVNFSPRLGRSVNFSPRLGKRIAYDMYPEHIRVERSLNETKSNE